MHLKSITVNNYRSIQNAKIHLEDGLNILIGKNGVGKSNLLKYINQNVSYAALGLRSRVFRNSNVEFEYTVCYEENEKICELTIYLKREKVANNNEIEYNREIRLSKKIDENYLYENTIINIPFLGASKRRIEPNNDLLKDFDILRKFQKQYVLFEIPSSTQWLSTPTKYYIDSEFDLNNDELYSDFSIFSNLESLLDVAFVSESSSFENFQSVEDIKLEFIKKIVNDSFEKLKSQYQLDDYLSAYSPISELRLNPNINVYYGENKILIDNLIIDFKVNDAWVPWSFLSDGTKRLFYLISECLCLTTGLLLIEEPELGIHPHQLYRLLDFIKEQSESKQILISTHSPIVLDILTPDELNRITVAKLSSNESQFFKLTKEQISKAKEYIVEVGELSYYWLHSDLENE